MELEIQLIIGVLIGFFTVYVLGLSCEQCGKTVCVADEFAPSETNWDQLIPASYKYAAYTLILIASVAIIAFFVLNIREAYRSDTYAMMRQAAKEHHYHCRAAIPETVESDWRTGYKARFWSFRDLMKVLTVNIYKVNIIGVGFPLYDNAMLLFLQVAVLFWLGNGLSTALYQDVVATACGDSHRKGAISLGKGFAEERAYVIMRLFVVAAILHLKHARDQTHLNDQWDIQHAEMSDYALLVEGFPESATSEKAIVKHIETALAAETPNDDEGVLEVVGVSVAYDYSKSTGAFEQLIQEQTTLQELSLDDSKLCINSFLRNDRFFCHGSGSSEEDNRAESLRLLIVRRENDEDSEGYVSDSSSSSGRPKHRREGIKEMLSALPNSGSAFVVFRYPVNTRETLSRVQRALDACPFERGRSMTVAVLEVEPPGIVWEHFLIGLFDKQPGCLSFITRRTYNLLRANLAIISSFLLLCLGYFFLYRQVYYPTVFGDEKVGTLQTLLVTISSMVGNIIINMVVWHTSKRVGFRMKVQSDAYIFRWFTAITLINIMFNIFVICVTFGEKPTDPLQRILWESKLASQLLVYVRGNVISYVIFPAYYAWTWFKGRAMLLFSYLFNSKRDWGSLRYAAEKAVEPTEWWLQYDYCAIVVMLMTCCMVLFFHGVHAWTVFQYGIGWALFTMLSNRIIYLTLSRETFYNTSALDRVSTKAQSIPLGMMAVATCHWARRSGDKQFFTQSIILVVVVCLVYVVTMRRFIQHHRSKSQKVKVWYEHLPYEKAEQMFPYNWWNVNPAHVLRKIYGVADDSNDFPHRRTLWSHGKGYSMPHF